MEEELEKLVNELKQIEILSYMCVRESLNVEEVRKEFREKYSLFIRKLGDLEETKPELYKKIFRLHSRVNDYRKRATFTVD